MQEITLPAIETPSKLAELIGLCKTHVCIEVNEHRLYYDSVEQYMSEREDNAVAPDILQKMIETDTIICLQFYPLTPIGFYIVFHYDLEMAIQEALDLLKKDA